MSNLLWEFYQQHMIHAARYDAKVAKHASEEARVTGHQLNARVARLELATSALWAILRDQFGLSDTEIVDRMREVDLADGKRDGKQVRPPVECPQCGRTTSATRPLCIYCGAEVETGL